MQSKKKTQKQEKQKKGISLIVLVLTIVVMVILAAAIIITLNNNNVINSAKDAVNSTNLKQMQEVANISWTEAYASGKKTESELNVAVNEALVSTFGNDIVKDCEITVTTTGVTVEKYVPVTNPYKDQEWEMAWTYTNGVWSDKIEKGGTAEGDIVAKLYLTGESITPIFYEMSLTPGNEYIMVVEGNGRMGKVTTESEELEDFKAWSKEYVLNMISGNFDKIFILYVSEIIICDGIENISEGAFSGFSSCKKVTLPKSVTDIEKDAFAECMTLSSINLPSVTSIGGYAFSGCASLSSINLLSVTSIGVHAFWGCTSLNKVKIFITDATDFTAESYAFGDLTDNSKIYVLKDSGVKEKLEEKYDSTKTTVIEVDTIEELKNI